MNDEDRRIQADEEEGSPKRQWVPLKTTERGEPVEEALSPLEEDREEQLRRQTTASTSASSVEMEPAGISRIPTQRDDDIDLRRRSTTLSRIETGRSVHSHTIGSGLRSRTVTRHSKRPMPNFGGAYETAKTFMSLTLQCSVGRRKTFPSLTARTRRICG